MTKAVPAQPAITGTLTRAMTGDPGALAQFITSQQIGKSYARTLATDSINQYQPTWTTGGVMLNNCAAPLGALTFNASDLG